MKKRDLEKELKKMGWSFCREGGSHEVWINRSGTKTVPIPRHNEIKENTARGIIKVAKENQ